MRYAIILGVILISVPLLLRLNTPEPYPDAESYTQLAASADNQRVADYIYSFLPGQLILIVCASLSLLLISFSYSDELFLLLLATSPAFIKTFTTAGPAALALVIIGLAVILVHKKKYWSVFAIPLCFSLSFSLGVLATITLIVIALVRNTPFIALGASFFALLSATVASIFAESLDLGFTAANWNDYFGIIGGGAGVTIFLIFLGFLGFLLQWNEERNIEHFAALLLILSSVFFQHGLIILAAFLSFYGSKALRFLAQREWHFEELRSITILLIACGVLFSVVIEEKERIALNEERIAAVRFITAAYPKGTSIASQQDVAPILAYKGYLSDWPDLPQSDAAVKNILAEQGYVAVVAKQDDELFSHLPIAYNGAYTVYEVLDG